MSYGNLTCVTITEFLCTFFLWALLVIDGIERYDCQFVLFNIHNVVFMTGYVMTCFILCLMFQVYTDKGPIGCSVENNTQWVLGTLTLLSLNQDGVYL